MENNKKSVQSELSLLDTHNEEFQDIIHRPYTNLIKLAYILVAIIIVGTSFCCVFVKCPDSIDSRVVISNSRPTVKVYSMISGEIQEIFVPDGSKVKKNTCVVLMRNRAEYKDVLSLKQYISDWIQGKCGIQEFRHKLEKTNYKMGELQNQYGEILLYLQQTESLPSTNEINCHLKVICNNVLASISQWEDTYMLRSPVNGEVSYVEMENQKQFVAQGTLLFSVTPNCVGCSIGRTMLKAQGIGNIRHGMICVVSLDNYPSEDYGNVIGRVESVSSFPVDNDNYLVKIIFPQGMRTNLNKKLPTNIQMTGNLSIMKNNSSLGYLVLEPILKIFRVR